MTNTQLAILIGAMWLGLAREDGWRIGGALLMLATAAVYFVDHA